MQRVRCGFLVPPSRPEIVAETIRAVYDGRHDLDELERRGREFVVAEADRTIALGRYRSLLRELAPA